MNNSPPPSLAVIITTAAGRLGYLRACLESLFASDTAGAAPWAILIENGLTPGLEETLAPYEGRIELIRHERRAPLSQTHNEGLEKALARPDVEFILILNDDTVLLPGSIERLINASRQHPDAIVTPLQLTYHEPHDADELALRAIGTGRGIFEDTLLRNTLAEVYRVDVIVGAALLARREVFEHIGPFDTLFEFYGLDDDYCARARYLGHELLLVPKSRILHENGRLRDTLEKDFDAWFRRWRDHQRSRLLCIAKQPDKPLWRNYVAATLEAARSCAVHAGNLWPRGIMVVLGALLRLFLRLPAIRATRRANMTPRPRARRVGEAQRNPPSHRHSL